MGVLFYSECATCIFKIALISILKERKEEKDWGWRAAYLLKYR